jgi:hypothetical protein
MKAAYNKQCYCQHSLSKEYCKKCNIWRKLRPNDVFTQGYSNEEEFEYFNISHKKNQITEITNQLRNVSRETPLKKLNKA